MDNMTTPLLELTSVGREYAFGGGAVTALKDVSLTIQAGEMLAIIGQSGSGKSTLMNILGCLDRPTSGVYRILGRETSALSPDELARLRREHFGFIFQRYHLLPDLPALANVEVPAVYAGLDRRARRARASALLARLGLEDKLDRRPSQLSGGQQQRVSIARALMNGGRVILADEPTGALDSQSGREMLGLLGELNQAGHTVIIVTHDRQVAELAPRIIEIKDGRVLSDAGASPRLPARPGPDSGPVFGSAARGGVKTGLERLREAARMALVSMASHRLRTALTMLGIVIGIASVVSVVALGEGSRQRILKDISAMGTNTINIFPGQDLGDERAARVRTLVVSDAEALAAQDYVDSVTPMVSTTLSLRHANISAQATVSGVGESYFRVHGYTILEGRLFDAKASRLLMQEAVIDENTRNRLFGQSAKDFIGRVILAGSLPCRVIGLARRPSSPFGNSESLNVWIPCSTVLSRLLGQTCLKSITVRVADHASVNAAQAGIERLLTQRHGRKDFFVMNTDSIRQTIEKTTQTMRLLISSIAVISLVVGGIGVMNIMLVSVTERTAEIGVRVAVGARQADIMRQFLIEAVLVCLLGGLLGILAALGVGAVFDLAAGDFRFAYTWTSMLAAFACSTLIGVVFGYLPAQGAARLDPVEALARE